MRIVEYVRPGQERLMALLTQVGVDDVVLRLPEPEGTPGPMPVDLATVRTVVDDIRAAGLGVSVIEPVPPMEKVKQGLPGRDAEIDHLLELLSTMEQLGIPLLCYNFMAFGWGRTRWDERERGGAIVTGFDADDLAALPSHPEEISADRMWQNYRYFLDAVLPVAEERGIRLALHPDDPPLSPYRGVARIMSTPDAIAQAMAMSDSPAHGLTFCQGTFATMGADIPATIRRFADRIRFVHFRDVRGTATRFVETWHDNGQTDMAAAMRTYVDIGFDGPMRSDHVPTMFGETNEFPGYETLGRLYAVGYLRGLWEASGGAVDPVA